MKPMLQNAIATNLAEVMIAEGVEPEDAENILANALTEYRDLMEAGKEAAAAEMVQP